ncbi:MAG: hypothetical protein R2798_14810 [Chitinophagales bacterium]|nr:hypothetical protein [Bacteroidota bacterium]MCB9043301.1 hypothetical protein [Chitinophagales bacterium]
MQLTAQIQDFLDAKFANTDCFVVGIDYYEPQSKILVFIDCMQGVGIDTCVEVSRYLENELESRGLVPEKYLLEISSPGMENPFRVYQQYEKNMGRVVKVQTNDGKNYEGTLQAVSPEGFSIELILTNKKNKDNQTTETIAFSFDDIKSVHKKVTFK